MQRVPIWDLPTRIFHWALVLNLVAMLVSINLDQVEWHARLGLFMLSLLLFRILWGFVGGHWSRFAQFPPSIGRVFAYLRNVKTETPGHNPLGAWSVYALLAFLLLQIFSGMSSDDEIAFSGPLVQYLNTQTVSIATFYHHVIGKIIILALVGLHITVIGYYEYKKKKLVRAMLSGNKTLPDTDGVLTPSQDTPGTRFRALLLFLGCVVVVQGLVAWLG